MQIQGLASGGANEIWALSRDRSIAALGMGPVLPPISCGQPPDPFAAVVRADFFYRPPVDGRENGMSFFELTLAGWS
jgi:hypothetical protein